MAQQGNPYKTGTGNGNGSGNGSGAGAGTRVGAGNGNGARGGNGARTGAGTGNGTGAGAGTGAGGQETLTSAHRITIPDDPHEAQQPEENWLLTYSDMITLLLAFFVILVAVSRYDYNLFDDLQQGLLAELTGQDISEVSTPLSHIKVELERILEPEMQRDLVDVVLDRDGVTLTFESRSFYASGEAEFVDEGQAILDRVAVAINEIESHNFKIAVEGHTDDVPISTPIFPSNWELSVARSANVVKRFIEQGIAPDRMRASGYAETRPVAPNIGPDGMPIPQNRARNRRVVIRIFY